jgi:hypothetical protein
LKYGERGARLASSVLVDTFALHSRQHSPLYFSTGGAKAVGYTNWSAMSLIESRYVHPGQRGEFLHFQEHPIEREFDRQFPE